MTDPVTTGISGLSQIHWPSDSYSPNPEETDDIKMYQKANEALKRLTSPFSIFPDSDGDDIDALARRLEKYATSDTNENFNSAFYIMAGKDPRIVALALLQFGNAARVAELLSPLKFFKKDSYDAILWYLADYGDYGKNLAQDAEKLINAIHIAHGSALANEDQLMLKMKVLHLIAKKYNTPLVPKLLNLTGRHDGFVVTGVVQGNFLSIIVSLGEREVPPQENHPVRSSEIYLNLFDSFEHSQDILNIKEYLYPNGQFVLNVDFEEGAYHAFFDENGAYTSQFFISY